MTEKKAAGPTVIVKDGVLPSTWEAELNRREDDAKKRRRQQDVQQAMSNQRYAPGQLASLRSHRMMTPDAPRLVLHYRKYGFDCVSEIITNPTMDGDGIETTFILVCPRCVLKGIAQGEAQLKITDSHRKFSIDTRVENRMPQVVNMFGTQQVVQPAGLVTVEDTIRCSNVSCGWAVRITDSQVIEV